MPLVGRSFPDIVSDLCWDTAGPYISEMNMRDDIWSIEPRTTDIPTIEAQRDYLCSFSEHEVFSGVGDHLPIADQIGGESERSHIGSCHAHVKRQSVIEAIAVISLGVDW